MNAILSTYCLFNLKGQRPAGPVLILFLSSLGTAAFLDCSSDTLGATEGRL